MILSHGRSSFDHIQSALGAIISSYTTTSRSSSHSHRFCIAALEDECKGDCLLDTNEIQEIVTLSQVYMTARDETRTKEDIDRFNEEGCEPGLGEVIWHELDLKELRSAK